MDESVLALMERYEASEEDMELAREVMRRQQGKQKEVEVWPENWSNWLFFMKVQMHWVHAGMDGVRVALDFPAIEVVAKALGYRGKGWSQLVEDLLVIQETALDGWRERRAEKDE